MKKLVEILETYLMVLVHPFRIHDQFRHQLPIPNHEGHLYPPLTLAESLGVSWVFAVIRGLARIIVLNFFLGSLLKLQSENFPFLQEFIQSSGASSYYFFIFSAALDIIFFPVSSIVLTEVWAWIIKRYSGWLNPDLPHDEISDQITTHALASNVFSIIPFIGDFVQSFLYYFLLYAGLRSNLGASRSLAWVILLTPTLLFFMFLCTFLFIVFYLVT
jgi:hypothetical protein